MSVIKEHARTLVVFGLLLAVLVGGLSATAALSRYGREEVRRGYLRAAMAAAAAFEGNDIALLSASPRDVGQPVYERTREQLIRLRQANDDSRFIYLVGLRQGKVVFLADAESPDSPDFSAPGDSFDEATPELREACSSGEPFVQGPVADRWGIWVSSFAPIRDQETGEVIAMLGWDWSARHWRFQTGIYLWLALALTVFTTLLLGASLIGYSRIARINRMLTEETTERRRAQGELQRLAKQDALTGLGNRRTFDSTLDLEWRRALRAQSSVSLCILDVDFFKAYNDHYGHQAGDQALQGLAECMRHGARRAGDEVCRYGGEEFAVILPGTDEYGARRVAEMLRANIEARAIVHEHSQVAPYMTVSVGFTTTVPTMDDSISSFVVRADKALYRAKAAGRNRVESMSPPKPAPEEEDSPA